jgi:hypothetical protein
MFRIEFFVDDKKLPAALLALVGIAHGQPNVMPVVNVKKKGNGLVAQTEGSGTDRFIEAVKKLKGKTVAASDLKAMMQPIGLAPKSYSYVLKSALEAKVMKKTGKGAGTATRYVVL